MFFLIQCSLKFPNVRALKGKDPMYVLVRDTSSESGIRYWHHPRSTLLYTRNDGSFVSVKEKPKCILVV